MLEVHCVTLVAGLVAAILDPIKQRRPSIIHTVSCRRHGARVGKLVTLAASEAPTSSHIHIILVDTLIFTGFNQPCLPAVSSLHHFASFYIMIRGKFTGRRAPCMFLVASWPLHGAVPLVPLVGAFAPGGTSSARHVKSTGRTGSAGASRRPQWWKGGGQQLTRAPSNQWLIIDIIILYYYMIWLGDIGGMMGI